MAKKPRVPPEVRPEDIPIGARTYGRVPGDVKSEVFTSNVSFIDPPSIPLEEIDPALIDTRPEWWKALQRPKLGPMKNEHALTAQEGGPTYGYAADGIPLWGLNEADDAKLVKKKLMREALMKRLGITEADLELLLK